MHPLVVDLDGTLILTDMLHESILRLLRDRPWDLITFPGWLSRGKAVFKKEVAEYADIDYAALPYNQPFLEWLREEKEKGRTIVLCTASDQKFAQAIANYLGLFDEVIASDGKQNMSGEVKASELVKRFGLQQFDYAGNSKDDLPVWQKAQTAIVVNARPSLLEEARKSSKVERVFPAKQYTFKTWLRVFRVHQWLKNILLFATCLAAHRLGNGEDWINLIIAFVSFGFCASVVYITNDLLDLDSDRLHPRKQTRPFASGDVPVALGVMLTPVLLIMSMLLAYCVSPGFLNWLLVYFILTSAYSFKLKRMVLIDCIVLALLYTLRVIAGAAAISSPLSFWLLALSVFLFLSLAFVKRCAELQVQTDAGNEKTHGRGYYTSDTSLIQILGVVSGYISVLVLALYINSGDVQKLYHAHEIIWFAVPVLLFWVSWIWLKVQRREMNDDPVMFAIKDPTSLVTGAIFLSVFYLGTMY